MSSLPKIQTNVLLAPYTTLGVGGYARYYSEPQNLDELRACITWAKAHGHSYRILGGGSNLLIQEEGFDGIVLRPQCNEISYTTISDGEVDVHVGASVLLDTCIEAFVEKELWGLENLSGIPGTVGATPIQNVGAYGVEVKNCIEFVNVYDTYSEQCEKFTNAMCHFGYRDSIFKKESHRYVIMSVTFRLHTKSQPQLHYKDLHEYFIDSKNISLTDIRKAVLTIRGKKFPNWNIVGTAGSFFKNPIVTQEEFARLKSKYPELPGYPEVNGSVKVSLGWILDRVCNLRGYHEDAVGLYENQALVLVCTKGISADIINTFAEKISSIVLEKTKIKIDREVTTL